MTFRAAILQVIPALDAGGAERTAVEIARAVVEAGGRALVATSGGRLAPEIEAAGGRIFTMPVQSKNPLTILANRDRLKRLVESERVDIIHVRSRAPAWSALWAAKATGRKLVSTYHGAYEAKSPLKRLYNSAMVRADLVIANSAYTAAAIRAQYAIDESRLRVIPRGADLDLFDPAKVSAARAAALARQWGLPAGIGALRLLLPGRLTSWKGQLTAIEAAALFVENEREKAGRSGASQAPVLQLVFAGDAQERDGYVAELRREIDRRGVRDMIHLVGHCADMPAAYAWADAALSPSTRPEAFGRVAVEAAAMARPVIAADHGGARETVVDGETGFLVTPGDARALAAAMAKVAALGAGGRAAMGARAQTRAREIYSSRAMCAATLEVYKALAGA
ncbi:MAG: glycosyltransferase family 4 protein [Pseudomonadota bacterium]|nr:glycosyltransferase family 4 protein [Pseudomonadota bacterium]